MQSRSVDELRSLALAGGSLVLHADVRPLDELISIAKSLRHGAQLTLQGTAFRPIEELQTVAQAAPGRVIFVG